MKGLPTILQFFDICVIVPKVPINILIILEKVMFGANLVITCIINVLSLTFGLIDRLIGM